MLPSASPRARVPPRCPRCPTSPRRLKGDIDAIVTTAMAKERGRRYNTASELDDEVARFLEARPVLAREPTLSYLAQRAIARHRVPFSIAAVSLCLLVGAFVIALWQARVAARERQRAVERYGDVRELASSIIFKIHDDVRALPGSTPVRRTVLAEGSEVSGAPGGRRDGRSRAQGAAGSGIPADRRSARLDR